MKSNHVKQAKEFKKFKRLTNVHLTLDGVKLKRGDPAWEVGITLKGAYRPTMGYYLSTTTPIFKLDGCWSDYLKCKKECAILNRRRIDKLKTKCNVCGEITHGSSKCNVCGEHSA